MRIALAEHTTVTYHTESEVPKTQPSNKFEALRIKLGFPIPNRASYYRNNNNRRKDHHTEHGVTTIVDLPSYEKTGNTFTPNTNITARTALTREVRSASSSGGRKNLSGIQSNNSSTEDISMKEILAQLPTSPPVSHTRAITFDLPEGHALSPASKATTTTYISSKGDRLDPEMMGLNRARPNTGGSTNSSNSNLKKPSSSSSKAPVLFVGENYHHRADITTALPSSITGVVNLKNAITVTTEKIVKSEGGADDPQ